MMKLNLAKVKTAPYLLILLSWGIVAFGQPAWSSWLCPISAVCGFALFWFGISQLSPAQIVTPRFLPVSFWWGVIWYGSVQLIQLSWLTSIDYQGYYILGVWVALCFFLGIQFGFLTKIVLAKQAISVQRILAAASLWVLLEWTRLFVLCGFSWNPVGLALTSFACPLQFANLFGVYGLSFWVILTNAFFFLALSSLRWIRWAQVLFIALLPYLYGACVLIFQQSSCQAELAVALVQTGLLPSQKVPLPGKKADFIHPLDQWKRIFLELETQKQKWDLIILPEAVVPLSAEFCVYPYQKVMLELQKVLGVSIQEKLPPLEPPFAEERFLQGIKVLCVSNAFFAKVLSNVHQAEVVIGLDHQDVENGCNYNSAFYVSPDQDQLKRYDKQILLPLAEYLPFAFLKTLTRRYGITDFFSHGKKALVAGSKYPFGLSICYEETFPHVMREGRLSGAKCFINVTNDNYYPFSKLPEQHFSHAKIRAVENGVPLLRACNTGVTAVVDHLGQTVARLGDGSHQSEITPGVLSAKISLKFHQTPYLYWGDSGILFIAFCSLALFGFFQIKISFFTGEVELSLKKKGV